jgi:hypothetical protein
MLDLTNCRVQSASMQRDAAQRVRERLRAWVQAQGHGSKKRLAEAVNAKFGHSKGVSWVTGILNGPDRDGQDVRLRDLDALAELLQVPPGELVRQDGYNYLELTMAETRVVRLFQRMPFAMREHLLALIDYAISTPSSSKTTNLLDMHTRRAVQLERAAPIGGDPHAASGEGPEAFDLSRPETLTEPDWTAAVAALSASMDALRASVESLPASSTDHHRSRSAASPGAPHDRPRMHPRSRARKK